MNVDDSSLTGLTPMYEDVLHFGEEFNSGEDTGDQDQDDSDMEPGPSRPWRLEGGPKRPRLDSSVAGDDSGVDGTEGMLDPDEIYRRRSVEYIPLAKVAQYVGIRI